MYITGAVLLKYEEKLSGKISERVAQNILSIIENALNAQFITTYYEWHATTVDFDDNKFFDAAVAANADYLVTNDAHFNEAKKLSFPKANVISANDFLRLLMESA